MTLYHLLLCGRDVKSSQITFAFGVVMRLADLRAELSWENLQKVFTLLQHQNYFKTLSTLFILQFIINSRFQTLQTIIPMFSDSRDLRN